MVDKIVVEMSTEDVERLADTVIARMQSMMESGEVLSYWVPKLLKLKQVADILNVPLSKVHAKIKSGEIPSLRFDDKTIRVDPRELYQYVKAHPNNKINHRELSETMEASRAIYASEGVAG